MQRITDGRIEQSLTQLATLIADASPGDGTQPTAVPGVYLSRWSGTGVPRSSIDRPVLCVVAQGAKGVFLDAERALYARGTYLLVSLDLPLVGEVVEASRAAPFLGLTLELDLAEVGALRLDVGAPAGRPMGARGGVSAGGGRAVGVHALDAELLDAVLRLARLVRAPTDAAVLAPLVRREIHYRLLRGPQGAWLAGVADARAGSAPADRVAAGLAWLRRHAARPVRMADLARAMHMSPSSMHAWFKAVTAMTPLQYQKQLRLQEARRLLLTEGADAATASRRVGYESPTQFSREYRRLFGAPPIRDVERLRGAAGGAPPLAAALESGVPAAA